MEMRTGVGMANPQNLGTGTLGYMFMCVNMYVFVYVYMVKYICYHIYACFCVICNQKDELCVQTTLSCHLRGNKQS